MGRYILYIFYKLHETYLQLYAKRDKGEMVLAKEHLPDTEFFPCKKLYI